MTHAPLDDAIDALTSDHLDALPGPIAVFGADGQVGSALIRFLGDKVLAFAQRDADFTQPASAVALLDKHSPAIVINAAAYTAVDKAEDEQSKAQAINATTPGALAEWCAAHDVPFIHYSTDYVFDGTGTHARDEDTPPAPLNVYGHTKLAGEEAVTAAGGQHLIFRTSWVYDGTGKNFMNTMIALGQSRPELNIVDDQIGAPTYAPHLASASLLALCKARDKGTDFPSGIYHMCNDGETSWAGFAKAIFAEAKEAHMPLAIHTVHPIPTNNYPTPAQRPLNSRLALDKLKAEFAITMPAWQDGLKHAIAAKQADAPQLSLAADNA